MISLPNNTSTKDPLAKLYEMDLPKLSAFFIYTEPVAAEKLECCYNSIKGRCRKLNIARWPFKTIKALYDIINKIDEIMNKNFKIPKLQKDRETIIKLWALVNKKPNLKINELVSKNYILKIKDNKLIKLNIPSKTLEQLNTISNEDIESVENLIAKARAHYQDNIPRHKTVSTPHKTDLLVQYSPPDDDISQQIEEATAAVEESSSIPATFKQVLNPRSFEKFIKTHQQEITFETLLELTPPPEYKRMKLC